MPRNPLVSVFLAVALASAVLSCSKGPEVIPKRQMERIYRDMFLADQWMQDSDARRQKADTTWFYEPIFEKYGYTVEDYRASVDYYLSDPKRYAEMIERVVNGLQAESEAIARDLRQQERIRHRADSIAAAMKALSPGAFVNYGDLFYVDSMTDRIEIKKNARGVYYPVPVVEDTIFHGPQLIIKDTTLKAAPVAEPIEKPIPWRK